MGAETALKSPTFIIEKNGKHYLSTGVLEYDPAKTISLTEQNGVAGIKTAFAGGPKFHAVEVDTTTVTSFAQTGPRRFSSPLAGGGALGFRGPTFIIAKDAKHYLTTGVLEYDRAKAISLTEENGVLELQRAFDGAHNRFEAAEVATATVTPFAQTRPRNVVIIGP